MVERARFFDGRKFMWDGEEYQEEEKVAEAQKQYHEKGFEVERCVEDEKTLLYTRRIVTEVVVDG